MTGEPKCPTCQVRVEMSPANAWRPFCSQRCRLIDLGEWLRGVRGIPEQGELPVIHSPEDETRH
ncbi:MAG: hypothetical protein A3H91_13220 [Gammaproteobacteria bacterium RIFCSPLOWO2_02_FULL_61_13]|nr:MAG: hypothetical protein A3H91_13220 [Gammaproteobacteria bacterium RIFCSPLOWO2_02_FULL_61_13]